MKIRMEYKWNNEEKEEEEEEEEIWRERKNRNSWNLVVVNLKIRTI